MTTHQDKPSRSDYRSQSASHLKSFLENDLPRIIEDSVRKQLQPLRNDLGTFIREAHIEAQAPLDSSEACKRLNCSRRKLDELVATGELRPLRIGRKRLFPIEQLEAFLRRCAK